MSPTPAPLQPPNAAEQQAEDAQYYRRVLHELIDMGTSLARAVHQQATRTPAPPRIPANDPAPDPTLAFDRIARCVRRTVALARALSEPPPPKPTPAQNRTNARKRIIRAVEDVIHRRATGPQAESLHAELQERLDGPDLEDDISSRPAAEIITEICKDLGLDNMPGAHPRKRRTPADAANLHARAAARPCAPRPQATARPPATPAPLPVQPGPNLPSDPAEAVAHILHYAPLVRRE